MHLNCKIVVILSLSHVRVLVTPWTAAHQASLYITNSWSLLKFMSVGDAIQSSHPLSSLSPPAFNLSQESGLIIGSGIMYVKL